MELYRVYSPESMRMWQVFFGLRIVPNETTDTGPHETKLMFSIGRRLKRGLMEEDINHVRDALNNVGKILAIQSEKDKEKLEVFEYFKLPLSSEGYSKLLDMLRAISISLGLMGNKMYNNIDWLVRDSREVLESGIGQGYRKV